MSFEVCPLCKGEGFITQMSNDKVTCSVCKGAKVISELTGLPPSDNKGTHNSNLGGDYRGIQKSSNDKNYKTWK